MCAQVGHVGVAACCASLSSGGRAFARAGWEGRIACGNVGIYIIIIHHVYIPTYSLRHAFASRGSAA